MAAFHSLRAKAGASFLIFALLLTFSSCKRGKGKQADFAYVSAPQANLRDRVAAVYNKVGVVKNAERVEVLEKSRRFVRVKTSRGEVGWVEERYLIDGGVYDGFQKLATENAKYPVQAHGTTRASLNMHVIPGRDTDHLFQMPDATKVDVLKRETADKPQAKVNPAPPKPDSPGAKKAAEKSAEAVPAREDWLLVRDQQGHTGWVLSRMIDIDIPMEIAQYSEGQRVVAYFVLNEVPDADKKVAQYLVLLTDNKDGLAWDYDQARVFTWNVKRHRYETAYRERRLVGVFPVQVGTADFGKDGVLPTFTLRVTNDDGKAVERNYKMNGPIVRRVLSPEEEQAKPKAQAKTTRRRK